MLEDDNDELKGEIENMKKNAEMEKQAQKDFREENKQLLRKIEVYSTSRIFVFGICILHFAFCVTFSTY